jgi:hypothetical protein
MRFTPQGQNEQRGAIAAITTNGLAKSPSHDGEKDGWRALLRERGDVMPASSFAATSTIKLSAIARSLDLRGVAAIKRPFYVPP